jgi:hypothetical protein
VALNTINLNISISLMRLFLFSIYRYTEARVKLFQKHKQQYRDKKLQLRMKRRMAKLLQMKSIAEKGRGSIS